MVMGKKNPSAKHDKQDGKEMNKSKSSVVMIDWDEVDEILNRKKEIDLSSDIITVQMLMDHYGIKETCARAKLRAIISSGVYEEYWVKDFSGNTMRLLARKIATSNKPLSKGQTK